MLLEKMKTGVAKWVIRVLAVILILSFGLWGVGDYVVGTGAPNYVAKVGDTQISIQDFTRNFQQGTERLRAVLGRDVDIAQARQLGLVDSTIDALVNARLLELEAHRLGLLIGQELIVRHIRDTDAFKNSAGEFDRLIFENTLAQSGMSEGTYVETLRTELARAYLSQSLTAGAIAPEPVIDMIYRHQAERRIADVVDVPLPPESEIPAPDDAALVEFHKTHAPDFTAPEYRTLSVLYLDPKKLADTIHPSAEDVAAEYQIRVAGLTVPETRELQQMVLPDEEAAKKAEQALAAGKTFEETAMEFAGMPADATKLGKTSKPELGSVLPTVADSVFSIPAGQHTAPVQSPVGWHIVKVVSIQPGHTPTLAEVKDRIALDIAAERAIDEAIRLSEEMVDEVAGGATFDEIATKLGIPILRFDGIDRRGRTADGKRPETLPADEKFLPAAFELAEGEISEVTETSGGGYFVLRVDKVTPSALKPLATVRDQVAKAWTLAQRTEKARERAQKIADAVKAGRSLSEAAREDGLTVRTTKPVSRFALSDTGDMPASLIEGLFRLQTSGVTTGPSADGYAVAQLNRVVAADLAPQGDERMQVTEALQGAISRDVEAAFTDSLRDRFPVEINRAAVDRYFEQTGG